MALMTISRVSLLRLLTRLPLQTESAEAMTALDAAEGQMLQEKIDGALQVAATGLLPETMQEQFSMVFADESDQLRNALLAQVVSISREQRSVYDDYLIACARNRLFERNTFESLNEMIHPPEIQCAVGFISKPGT